MFCIFQFLFCCLYISLAFGVKSLFLKNIEATKSAFYAPSKLLTEGIYARVQHPMIIGDILGHFFFGVINRWNLHLHFIPYICIYRSLYDKNTG